MVVGPICEVECFEKEVGVWIVFDRLTWNICYTIMSYTDIDLLNYKLHRSMTYRPTHTQTESDRQTWMITIRAKSLVMAFCIIEMLPYRQLLESANTNIALLTLTTDVIHYRLASNQIKSFI